MPRNLARHPAYYHLTQGNPTICYSSNLENFQTLRLARMAQALHEHRKRPAFGQPELRETPSALVGSANLTERRQSAEQPSASGGSSTTPASKTFDYGQATRAGRALILNEQRVSMWLRDGLNLIIGGATGSSARTCAACALATGLLGGYRRALYCACRA